MQIDQIAMDIGGTSIRFSKNGMIEKLDTSQFPSFLLVLQAVLTAGKQAEIVCAIAGPVNTQGAILPTNIRHWGLLQPGELEKQVPQIKIRFINDLVAFALGVDFVSQEGLLPLKEGKNPLKQKKLLVAPGTGLGVAFKNGSEVFSSEAGHVDYVPYGPFGEKIFRFLREKYGHVSVERVVSGMGLEEWGPLLDQKEVFVFFAAQLGRFLGNMTVAFLPDVIYLGGGVVLNHLSEIRGSIFEKALLDQGRFDGLVNMPSIYVVQDPLVSLKGAKSLLSSEKKH